MKTGFTIDTSTESTIGTKNHEEIVSIAWRSPASLLDNHARHAHSANRSRTHSEPPPPNTIAASATRTAVKVVEGIQSMLLFPCVVNRSSGEHTTTNAAAAIPRSRHA